jgi:hypothetical protein
VHRHWARTTERDVAASVFGTAETSSAAEIPEAATPVSRDWVLPAAPPADKAGVTDGP